MAKVAPTQTENNVLTMEAKANGKTDSSDKLKNSGKNKTEPKDNGDASSDKPNGNGEETSLGNTKESKGKSGKSSKKQSPDKVNDSPRSTNDSHENDASIEQKKTERKHKKSKSRRKSQRSIEDESDNKQSLPCGISVPDMETAMVVLLTWIAKPELSKCFKKIKKVLSTKTLQEGMSKNEVNQFMKQFPVPNIFINNGEFKHEDPEFPPNFFLDEQDKFIAKFLKDGPYSHVFQHNVLSLLLCQNKSEQEMMPVYERLKTASELAKENPLLDLYGAEEYFEENLMDLVKSKGDEDSGDEIDEMIVKEQRLSNINQKKATRIYQKKKNPRRKKSKLDPVPETMENDPFESLNTESEDDDLPRMARKSEKMHMFMDELDQESIKPTEKDRNKNRSPSDEDIIPHMARKSEKMHRFMDGIERDSWQQKKPAPSTEVKHSLSESDEDPPMAHASKRMVDFMDTLERHTPPLSSDDDDRPQFNKGLRSPSPVDNDLPPMAHASETMHRFIDNVHRPDRKMMDYMDDDDDSGDDYSSGTKSLSDDLEEPLPQMARTSEKMHQFMENVDKDNKRVRAAKDRKLGEEGDNFDTFNIKRNKMSRTTGDIQGLSRDLTFRVIMDKFNPIIKFDPEEKVLRYLNAYIHRGKDVSEIKDVTGRTLLHHCVRRNHIQVAKLLMNHGADPMARDIYEITPLRLALDAKLDDMAALIISHSPPTRIVSMFSRPTKRVKFQELLNPMFEKTLCAALVAMKTDNDDGSQTIDFTPLGKDEQGNFDSKDCDTAYQTLAFNGHKEILSHPVVHALTNHKWAVFGRINFLISAINYLFSLFVLTFACVVGATTDNVLVYDDGLQIARAVFEVIAYIYAVITMVYGVFYMIRHRYERFLPSTYIDILASLLIVIALPVRYTHVQEHWYILAFGYMLWVTRLFTFTVYFSGIGIYSEALRRTVLQDFTQFFIIFAVILLAFGGMFILVQRGDSGLNSSSVFGTYQYILYAGLRTMVEGGPVVDYEGYRPMSTIVLLVFLLVTIVVMLNFLIAQLSNTYGQIEAQAVKSVIANRAWIIARLEKRGFIFRRPNFVKEMTVELSKLTPEVKVTTEEKIEKAFAESKARQVEIELQVQIVKNRLFEYHRRRRLTQKSPSSSLRVK